MTIADIASIATACGVLLAWWQLWASQQQARTTFEDRINEQYRDLMRELPVSALLGEALSEEESVRAMPVFYHYFDLCNEQAYLHKKRRIRHSTWREWREGITMNMDRPAFAQAWAEVATRLPETFDELRSVISDRRAGRRPESAAPPTSRTLGMP